MSQQRPSIILADDHPMVLEGLASLLEPALQVVARVVDGEALLAATARLQPDLVIADISMPGVDGLEVTRRLSTLSPATRTLILSIHSDPHQVRSAFAAGAWAFLTKGATGDEIHQAIEEVLRGNYYVSPPVTHALIPAAGEPTDASPVPNASPPAGTSEDDGLTRRELEVARLVGAGWSNYKIADHLGIAVTTVRTHLSNTYTKLGHISRVELALFGARADESLRGNE